MDAVFRKFYQAERYKVRRAVLEIARGYKVGGSRKRPVMRSDGVVYPSATEAAKAMGLHDSAHISEACRDGSKTAAGFGWRYLEGWEAAAHMGKPGEFKNAHDYESADVFAETMRRLRVGTCGTCKFYAKTGGRCVCRQGPRTVDTDKGATCARWEPVPTPEAIERAKAEEAKKEAAIAKAAYELRKRKEEKAQAVEAERAGRWAFRNELLAIQVDLLVGSICKHYDIGPGTGPR